MADSTRAKLLTSPCTAVGYSICETAMWMVRVIPVMLLVIGTCGNLLSIMVFCRKKLRQHSTTIYILFMAISDMICLYLSSLRVLYQTLHDEQLESRSSFHCAFLEFAIYVSVTYSLYLLSLLSIERMLFTRFPFFARTNMTRNKAIVLSIIALVFVLLLHSHLLFGLVLVEEWQDDSSSGALVKRKTCVPINARYADFFHNKWGYIVLILNYFAPFFIVVTNNIIITKALLEQRKKIAPNQDYSTHKGKANITDGRPTECNSCDKMQALDRTSMTPLQSEEAPTMATQRCSAAGIDTVQICPHSPRSTELPYDAERSLSNVNTLKAPGAKRASTSNTNRGHNAVNIGAERMPTTECLRNTNACAKETPQGPLTKDIINGSQTGTQQNLESDNGSNSIATETLQNSNTDITKTACVVGRNRSSNKANVTVANDRESPCTSYRGNGINADATVTVQFSAIATPTTASTNTNNTLDSIGARTSRVPNTDFRSTKTGKSKHGQATTKLLFIMSAFGFVTIVPYCCFNIYMKSLVPDHLFGVKLAVNQLIHSMVYCLVLSNVAINFVWYLITSTLFKNEMKSMFKEFRSRLYVLYEWCK